MDRPAGLLMVSLPDIPFAVIYVVAVSLCPGHRRQHPRKSGLALTAFVLFFLRLLVNLTLRTWLLLRTRENIADEAAAVGLCSGIANIISPVPGVAARVYLLRALFGPEPTPAAEDAREVKGRNIPEGAVRIGWSPG